MGEVRSPKIPRENSELRCDMQNRFGSTRERSINIISVKYKTIPSFQEVCKCLQAFIAKWTFSKSPVCRGSHWNPVMVDFEKVHLAMKSCKHLQTSWKLGIVLYFTEMMFMDRYRVLPKRFCVSRLNSEFWYDIVGVWTPKYDLSRISMGSPTDWCPKKFT